MLPPEKPDHMAILANFVKFLTAVFVVLLAGLLGFHLFFTQSRVERFVVPSSGWEVISRDEWGADNPSEPLEKLRGPVSYVIIAHTATKFCVNFTQCAYTVQAIQAYHFSRHFLDISYNFLIGGDGNAYEARGWDFINTLRNDSLVVSFIGNFQYDDLTWKMKAGLENLLMNGANLGKLARNFQILCHNQVAATLSPGFKACHWIKTLENYDTGKYF